MDLWNRSKVTFTNKQKKPHTTNKRTCPASPSLSPSPSPPALCSSSRSASSKVRPHTRQHSGKRRTGSGLEGEPSPPSVCSRAESWESRSVRSDTTAVRGGPVGEGEVGLGEGRKKGGEWEQFKRAFLDLPQSSQFSQKQLRLPPFTSSSSSPLK